MPAAAVIPAPIAYIKVVAVKTLVVESWVGRQLRDDVFSGGRRPIFFRSGPCGLYWLCGVTAPDVYFEKIRVFKAGVFAVNTLAWNNGTGLWSCFVGFNGRSND